jgi:hypothetical protein
MKDYKEYKYDDDERRRLKQGTCVHCDKVTLYTSCGTCGKPIRKILRGEDIDKPIFVKDLLCQCAGD